jgi:hypothetical protein
VVIAITDDGVSLSHPDLSANIWGNDDEIANNGIDDDGNGFIDDVNGWDFASNDRDPSPVAGFSHGTHVAGIAAARVNNSVGVAGTAGDATIMPIRFYGSGSWTSTVVANSFRYAVDNGAKILSDSYNIDGFVGDLVYASAVQYVYNRGALYFNSGGNGGTLNPARQAIDQVMLVVNSTANDLKAFTSNYGWGMDIAAPGTSIYSTIPNASYTTMSGTSMAAPNAAAAAALIWSAHPDWTRDQVAAQLIGSADNIDALNPNFAALMGSGRVNSFRAVTQTIAPPRLRGLGGLPADNASAVSIASTFTLDVASVFDPATVSSSAFELRGDGADNTFNTPDDVLVPLSLNTAFAYGTNRLRFTIDSNPPPDTYRFSALPALRDPFGQAIDGNGDGTAGDAFTRTFSVVGVSGAYRVTVAGQDVTGLDFGNRSTVAPRVIESVFEYQSRQAIQFRFSGDVGASLSAADLVLRNDTTGQIADSSLIDVSYDGVGQTATFTFTRLSGGLLGDGDYTATVAAAGIADPYGNALAGETELSFFVLAGDANRDRRIDVMDLGIVASNWGKTGLTFGDGDFDYSGVVNVFDLGALATSWQQVALPSPLWSGNRRLGESARIIEQLLPS